MNEDKWQTIHNGIAHSQQPLCDRPAHTQLTMGYTTLVCIYIIRIYQRKSQLFPNAHSLISTSNPAHITHTQARARTQISFFRSFLRPALALRHHLIVAKTYLFSVFFSHPSTSHRRRRLHHLHATSVDDHRFRFVRCLLPSSRLTNIDELAPHTDFVPFTAAYIYARTHVCVCVLCA